MILTLDSLPKHVYAKAIGNIVVFPIESGNSIGEFIAPCVRLLYLYLVMSFLSEPIGYFSFVLHYLFQINGKFCY